MLRWKKCKNIKRCKPDDSIMHVESTEIASELMELIFGKDDK